jgi:hypothetical protein
MNRDHDYGGILDNQLRAMEHIGLFAASLPDMPQNLPRYPDPYDSSRKLEERARTLARRRPNTCGRPRPSSSSALSCPRSIRANRSWRATPMFRARREGLLGDSPPIVIPAIPLYS